MIRRTFFQLIAGFSIPLPRWHTERSPEAAELVPKPVQFLPANDVPDPEWLREWLRLARFRCFPMTCRRSRSHTNVTSQPLSLSGFAWADPSISITSVVRYLENAAKSFPYWSSPPRLMPCCPARTIQTRSTFSPSAKPAMRHESSASTACRLIARFGYFDFPQTRFAQANNHFGQPQFH